MSVVESTALIVQQGTVSAYKIPTDGEESDGTFQWDHTTIVVVEFTADRWQGLGYTYADSATAVLIRDLLLEKIIGKDAGQIAARVEDMQQAVRNLGRPGICSMAISAVDACLWDLKAKSLDTSLTNLLGPARDAVELYGSGGFTSYDEKRLCNQLADWSDAGFCHVKMKIGRDAMQDPNRVAVVRNAIADDCQLFVDANGAYSRKQALAMAEVFADFGVSWFEEPVPSDDLPGLRLLRDHCPPGMQIAAGEYGYEPAYFRQMLEAEAVDVLQADMTRCGGISGFLKVAAICESFGLRLSAHCAPALHLPVCCAAPTVCHQEYFYDHVRIEEMLFDGVPQPVEGRLRPDLARPGFGLEFKRDDARRWEIPI
jgi:L-alanine-DL-glutamate epimerase-like enolase superfamily enzyme